MCGITGIFRPDGGSADMDVLRRMTAALAHRGPDGDGFHAEPGLGLGHRRLAIIDPTGGEQPMFNEDGSVAIVFNGMIYNYRELMALLQGRGHVFRTKCDTETIVHAWEEWGPDCVQHLNGFFAFAIWDRRRGQLFLARDRLGKKPLHYAKLADGSLAFSSELSSFAQVPGLARKVSATAVDDFFTYGYIPDPGTIYEGILKLPAAHSLLVERGSRRVVPQRYWSVPTATAKMDAREAAQALVDQLRHSVGQRMIADVPLGAFLSGGVDSSAVVALAAPQRGGTLDTFTIGFDGAEDETPYAEMVAKRYGTAQHNERAAAVDMIDAARLQGRIFGEPFGDQSSVPTHSVCALARKYATVAISGDGGDEVFAGYRRYRWHVLTEGVRRLVPSGMRKAVFGTLARAYPKLDGAPRWLRAKYTLTELSLDSAASYLRTVTRVHQEQRRALFSPMLAGRLGGYDPGARIPVLMEEAGTDDPLVQAQYADLQTWLSGGILTKVDRASMANSLEVRAPILDYRFVEWGLSLPRRLKLRGGEGKYIFKKAMEPHLPREVLYRPKQGFATSLAGPFRTGIGRLRERLLGPAMLDSGLFERPAIARLLDEHEAGAFDHSMALWQLLVFEGFLFHELPAAAGSSADATLALA
ncbi:MAG: asparagine synthase (glutamine-hydrolyzing) [Alphaproteobacteria bacterium]|nr:asparagine synthase (glutamine-hydrolyzing) [Alphaproteobacteria bacterium]